MSVDIDELASRNGHAPAEDEEPQALSVAAARNLATVTKTAPQMQEITSRWLLRMLPWVNVSGGTYRVNRRRTHRFGDGRLNVVQTGAAVELAPRELTKLPALDGFGGAAALEALARGFTQRELDAGTVLASEGEPVNEVLLIAHGKVSKVGSGKYGGETRQGLIADGEYLGAEALANPDVAWPFTVRTATACTVLSLPLQAFRTVLDSSAELRAHLETFRTASARSLNRYGEAAIAMAAGHEGEVRLPGTFVDYDTSPREYSLGVAQTVLRIHTRVADLYNDPMNQVEQQLRLTIESLRERQDFELVNNPDFGLLHNVDYGQRLHTHDGPPTPDDLDELLSRRRDSHFFLAHPRAIAAFGRECNRRGLYPNSVQLGGKSAPAWRDVPILPCSKIPITPAGTTSFFVLRTGEDNQGVVGLHQTGIPDEYEPSLNVRFMGISDKAIMSYLVSVYFSMAILVPDAVGMLENVEVARAGD